MEATSSASSNRPVTQVQPRTWGLLDIFLRWLLFATLAGSCGAWHWLLDLFSHFRWYYFVISLIWIIVICRSNRRRSKWCLGLVLIWNGGLLWPYYAPVTRTPVSASATTVSLVSMNVYTANQNKPAVVDYLRDRQPDLVIVMEVDQKWAEALQPIGDLYPYRFIQPRPDNFGIGLLSKWPLIEPRFVEFADTQLPNIVTRIEYAGHVFQLVATHPLPPIGATRADERNSQLRELGDFVKRSSLPTIVAGDLNATPWSVAFRDIVSRSSLRDSALGLGVQGTWNAKTWIRIPIDHALIPPDMTVVRRSVGPDVGSDHFPLEVTVAFP